MKHYFKTISALVLLLVLSCGKDDEPTNSAPIISAQSFDASEDANEAIVFGTVKATDPDGDTLSFSIVTNSNDLFEISSSGGLSLVSGASLDFETTTSHALTVVVSDGKESSSATITITVLDVNENATPTIADQTFSIAEDVDDATVIATIIGTDPEGSTLTYTIGNKGSEVFELTTTGELSLKSGIVLDFENISSYKFSVTASDGEFQSTAEMTVNVTDVNEAPVFSDDSRINIVQEDVADDEDFGFIIAVDPEGDTITYSLTTNPDNLFEINADGEISLDAGKSLDYETATSHTITVQISDGTLSATKDYAVDVNDVDESVIDLLVSSFAGSVNGLPGTTDASGPGARFRSPGGIAFFGGDYYIADTGNHRIRKMDASGTVTTFAGSTQGYADGLGTAAQFNGPSDIAVDAAGNLFVSDTENHRIRKITPSGQVTTFAGNGTDDFIDGNGTTAAFSWPIGVCFANGNLFVADSNNNMIRRITPSGDVTRYAGTITSRMSGGYANGNRLLEAQFKQPYDIIYDRNAQVFYVSDSGNQVIRNIRNTVTVGLYAGTPQQLGFNEGPQNTGKFSRPQHIFLVGSSSDIYVADRNNQAIRKITSITTSSGGGFGTSSIEIVNVAGFRGAGFADGGATTAQFFNPNGIYVTGTGTTIFVTEQNAHRVRKIDIN